MLDAAVTTHIQPFEVACRICGNHDLERIEVREMMFGLRERFTYLVCRSCGCLQIGEYLENLEKYYPNDYYSFLQTESRDVSRIQSETQRFGRYIKAHLINFSRRIRSGFLKSKTTRQWLRSRSIARLYLKYVENPKAAILDVGCGSGTLLKDLSYLYYTNLSGCDPFIPNDIYHHGRLLVRKARLNDLSGPYDCISFHHVLEHMPNQLSVLSEARTLLGEGGLIMIRIPVMGSAAWRSYRENWVQIDPPRHYYLHSERSLVMLAEQAGLEVVSVDFDSSGFQFWGSEMYVRNVPLSEALAPGKSVKSFFSTAELEEFETRAHELNQLRDGDQIIAVLKRKK